MSTNTLWCREIPQKSSSILFESNKHKTMSKLSICIPTYKRPEFLKGCLESIINQASEFQNVAIHVFDDSESDINVGVIKAISSKFKNVYHHINPRNLGIDLNIQNCVDAVDSEYVWLIGEDDIFLPEAVKNVIDKISTDQPAFICANYAYLSENQKDIISFAFENNIKNKVSSSDFVRFHLWKIGFIGSCIINKEYWNKTIKEPYFGTYFTHVGRVIEVVENYGSVTFINKACVGNRSQGLNTFTWKNDSFGVFLGFENMCRIAMGRVRSLREELLDAIYLYRKINGHYRLRALIRFKHEGLLTIFQYQKYIKNSNISKAKKFYIKFLCYLPDFFITPLIVLHKIILKMKSYGD